MIRGLIEDRGEVALTAGEIGVEVLMDQLINILFTIVV